MLPCLSQWTRVTLRSLSGLHHANAVLFWWWAQQNVSLYKHEMHARSAAARPPTWSGGGATVSWASPVCMRCRACIMAGSSAQCRQLGMQHAHQAPGHVCLLCQLTSRTLSEPLIMLIWRTADSSADCGHAVTVWCHAHNCGCLTVCLLGLPAVPTDCPETPAIAAQTVPPSY